MDNVMVSAKTYDEAITKALIELQTTSEHLHVDIIEKGSSGLFGVLGGKPCVIRARIMSEEEEAAEKKAAEEKQRAEEEKRAAEEAARKKEEALKETPAPAVVKTAEAVKEPAGKEETNTADQPEQTGRKESAAPEYRHRSSDDKPKKEVSEEEAAELQKKAEAFLSQIFETMEANVKIETSFDHEENELSALLTGDDMGILIGKRGQTLDSLQYLVSLVVNKHHDGYIRIKLDTENYRERREAKLQSLAKNIAFKVKRTRKPVSLEPMNPYERRIIHSALQNDAFVTTYSEGEDPYRHIVVILKKDAKKYNRNA